MNFSEKHIFQTVTCVLDREFWAGTETHPLGREGGGRGGGWGVNHKTTKTTDISKQHSKQAKTGKVERNYKTFADQVHKSGTYIYLYM